MDTQTVWTRQHENVWNMLQETGRYTARREYIQLDLQEQAPLVLAAYDWLTAHGPDAGNRPEDVDYPVWVSFSRDGTMLPDAHTVILELALPPSRITHINIAKWGMILNYSYIPLDEADQARHQELLEAYRISDAQAFLSRFYPQIKREIQESWMRLFDSRILPGNDLEYGTIWEIRKEWIRKVITPE